MGPRLVDLPQRRIREHRRDGPEQRLGRRERLPQAEVARVPLPHLEDAPRGVDQARGALAALGRVFLSSELDAEGGAEHDVERDLSHHPPDVDLIIARCLFLSRRRSRSRGSGSIVGDFAEPRDELSRAGVHALGRQRDRRAPESREPSRALERAVVGGVLRRQEVVLDEPEGVLFNYYFLLAPVVIVDVVIIISYFLFSIPFFSFLFPSSPVVPRDRDLRGTAERRPRRLPQHDFFRRRAVSARDDGPRPQEDAKHLPMPLFPKVVRSVDVALDDLVDVASEPERLGAREVAVSSAEDRVVAVDDDLFFFFFLRAREGVSMSATTRKKAMFEIFGVLVSLAFFSLVLDSSSSCSTIRAIHTSSLDDSKNKKKGNRGAERERDKEQESKTVQKYRFFDGQH